MLLQRLIGRFIYMILQNDGGSKKRVQEQRSLQIDVNKFITILIEALTFAGARVEKENDKLLLEENADVDTSKNNVVFTPPVNMVNSKQFNPLNNDEIKLLELLLMQIQNWDRKLSPILCNLFSNFYDCKVSSVSKYTFSHENKVLLIARGDKTGYHTTIQLHYDLGNHANIIRTVILANKEMLDEEIAKARTRK